MSANKRDPDQTPRDLGMHNLPTIRFYGLYKIFERLNFKIYEKFEFHFDLSCVV